MTLRSLALAALLPACTSAPVSPTPAGSAPTPPETTDAETPSAPAPAEALGAAPPDTTLYLSAAASDRDRDAVLIRDLDELGVTPIGAPEADVTARFGAPDSDDLYTLGEDFPGGELRVEILNTTRDRQARGEDVQVREMTWRLPNNWIRKVWLHDAPGGWAVADGLEWANDRVNF